MFRDVLYCVFQGYVLCIIVWLFGSMLYEHCLKSKHPKEHEDEHRKA